MTISASDREKLNDFKLMFKQLINLNNDQNIDEVIEALFLNIEKYYLEFGDSIKSIPVRFEPYKFHILQPINGRYSLLDFLINRAFSNIDDINAYADQNGFDNAKFLLINPHRYDEYVGKYDFDFLEKQKLKSKLHETGHALQALDVVNDGNIHQRNVSNYKVVPLVQKVRFINRKLGHKYPNLLKEYMLNGVEQTSKSEYFSVPFNNNSLCSEGLDEMYAILFSGLYDEINKFDYVEIMPEKVYSTAPNHFNGYAPFCRFFYYLRCLSSKESLFMSTFLASEKALEEFASKNEKLINYWWNYEDLKSVREKVNSFNEARKKYNSPLFLTDTAKDKLSLLLYFSSYSYVYNSSNIEDHCLDAQIALDWIFFRAFEQKYMSNNYNYDEFLQQLQIAYNSSMMVLDDDGKSFRPSKVKEGYKYLIQHLLKKHNNIKMANEMNANGEAKHRKK